MAPYRDLLPGNRGPRAAASWTHVPGRVWPGEDGGAALSSRTLTTCGLGFPSVGPGHAAAAHSPHPPYPTPSPASDAGVTGRATGVSAAAGRGRPVGSGLVLFTCPSGPRTMRAPARIRTASSSGPAIDRHCVRSGASPYPSGGPCQPTRSVPRGRWMSSPRVRDVPQRRLPRSTGASDRSFWHRDGTV